MALPQSALSELLDAFRAGDGVDLIRDSVRVALQELIELEATERIGAAPYERTEGRVSERNGHRPRSLTTTAGDVELRIPKLRKGSFFPIILEPRRRIDQALYAHSPPGPRRVPLHLPRRDLPPRPQPTRQGWPGRVHGCGRRDRCHRER